MIDEGVMTGTSPGVAAWETIGRHLSERDADRREQMRHMRFDTIAVHGVYDAQAALANQGRINEPLFLSPAQHFAESDQMETALAYRMPAWTYTRIANPTVHYLEEALALLETYGSDVRASACATASGMAAVFMATEPFLALDASLPPPNIVATAKCYGGTFMLFSERYGRERGIDVRWVCEPLDPNEWASKIDAGTRLVYGEMPSNPAVAVFDIPAVAALAHDAGVPLIVDSTVATPALLRPLAMGADIVVQSLSKSLAGSGMAIGGAVVARHDIPSRTGPDELLADFATHVKLLPFRDHGPAMSPFNALVTLSDMRTIRSRIDQWSRGAMQVAAWLAEHPKVERVQYPGLPSFPGYQIARRDMWLVDGDDRGMPVNRYGPLMAFDVRGGPAAARRVFDGLGLVWRATDLGRIKSVATIPAISTHQQQGEQGRKLACVPSHEIRLSIGGEHPDDLIADLDQALGRI
jgi:O-acetylhomoserine/O-acetylserine sulfhydrylase-like pyridoxal-dependent enzyme